MGRLSEACWVVLLLLLAGTADAAALVAESGSQGSALRGVEVVPKRKAGCV
jgi:hypothetical protein